MYEAKKGKTLKEICSKVAVVRREATFKLAPTGGVKKPISQVATVNTQNNNVKHEAPPDYP
jgi:hypothetical protein